MKYFTLFFFVCIYACNNFVKNDSSKINVDDSLNVSKIVDDTMSTHNPKVESTKQTIVIDKKDLLGYWVGMFMPDSGKIFFVGVHNYWDYSNKINISIDSFKHDSIVFGHSVVAGNYRFFKGFCTLVNGDNYYFKVKESGKNKYDGTFDFSIQRGDSILNGKWKSYKKIRISSRHYQLKKSLFSYNPDLELNEEGVERFADWKKIKKSEGYNMGPDTTELFYDDEYFSTTHDVYNYNASKKMLRKDDVANLSKGDLFIIRNSIYARHGYSFKNTQLRVFFDKQKWYVPVSTNVKQELTEIERKNIQLLLKYEKNANEYYDRFGRG